MTSEVLPSRVRLALAGPAASRHVAEVLRLHAELPEPRADLAAIAEVVRAGLETAACGLVALTHDGDGDGDGREEILREALGAARAAVVAARMALMQAGDERRRGDRDAEPSGR